MYTIVSEAAKNEHVPSNEEFVMLNPRTSVLADALSSAKGGMSAVDLLHLRDKLANAQEQQRIRAERQRAFEAAELQVTAKSVERLQADKAAYKIGGRPVSAPALHVKTSEPDLSLEDRKAKALRILGARPPFIPQSLEKKPKIFGNVTMLAKLREKAIEILSRDLRQPGCARSGASEFTETMANLADTLQELRNDLQQPTASA